MTSAWTAVQMNAPIAGRLFATVQRQGPRRLRATSGGASQELVAAAAPVRATRPKDRGRCGQNGGMTRDAVEDGDAKMSARH